MKKIAIQATLGLVLAVAAQLPARAQAMPDINPNLKKMLGALPLAEIKDEVQGLLGALHNATCGGGLKGCYMAKAGGLQLYFFSSQGVQQTFLLVINKKVLMPPLLHNKAQQVLAGTSLSAPIISISSTDYTLTTAQMPPDLQAVVRDSYFNVPSLAFASGVQLAARADLGGTFRTTMESLGVKADQLTLRAAVVMPIPTDLLAGAASGAAMAGAESFKKAGADAIKPEAFVEFQFAPNARLPLLMPAADVTDATFFLNNDLFFGYKGNATFQGMNKSVLLQFQTPLSPAGAMDLLDFSFRMATPASFTLEDGVKLMVAMASPDPRLAKYGGGFIRNIESIKKPLLAVAKPLSVFQLRNPQPVPDYRFADPSKPFPNDPKYFNLALVSPLAAGGPQLSLAGEARIMGQTMGGLNLSAGLGGFHGSVQENLSLKLGPLGRVGLMMKASADVTDKTQLIHLQGSYLGRSLDLALSGTQLTIDSPATCLSPFEIKAKADIQDSMNVSDILDAQAGANVDPTKISGCLGDDLKKALTWISSTGSALGGYTAAAATQELANQEKLAAAAYNQAKDAARKAANDSVNDATKAFKDAGNAISKAFGGKKKHSPKPDPKFAESAFDWDYFYDQYPALVAAKTDLVAYWRDTGFDAGKRGSLEFYAKYYRGRYLDVQAACGPLDELCALTHWLWTGIDQGRQGSADFSVLSYLNRYPDLQRNLGPENYADALDHWINVGKDGNRNGAPDSSANGPVSGPVNAGGTGGTAWSDTDVCAGRAVSGFRVGAGTYVDTLQFRYGSTWATKHGPQAWENEVLLASNEYIVQVDYGSGNMLDHVRFVSNLGKSYGPYGGSGGGQFTYKVTPGERLGCMTGRAGSSMDRLVLLSTGLR